MPPRSRTPARRRRTPKLVAGGGLIAVVVAGLVARAALADSPGSSSSFRTAVVTSGNVSQVLERSATIEPIAQAAVAFPVAGTVTAVSVQPGQTVTTGQTLATLDTTALQNDVAAKQATLAAAELTLQNALDAANNAAAQSATSTTVASTGGGGSRSGGSDPSAGIESAAQQVVSAKQNVDSAVGTATTAVQNAAAACTSSSSSSTPSSSDCSSAQQSSLAALQAAADAEGALAKSASALDSMLNTGFVISSTSGSSSNASSASSSSAVPGGNRGGSGGASASAVPSAADLVADQAAVDAAASAVTASQQNLAQAVIVSPLAGTVAAVNLVPAQQVSAGSSTADVIVVGPGGYEATTTVPVTDIAKVKPGEDATITPDGTNAALPAKVVSIGVSPSTSGSTTSYPVILGFDGSPTGLRNGASAAVTITVAHAADVMTVPTSAVHSAGGFNFVMTLVNGKATNTPVQVGAVGPDVTEITSGLQSGQTVVLADLSQPLPSLTTTNVRGIGGGGFGGGGSFGGGAGFGGGGGFRGGG